MQVEERLKWLLNAGPKDLDAFDKLRKGENVAERAGSLRLLRPGEAAQALNMSRTSLWRLTQEKRIATVEIRRGAIRYSEDALRRFVEGRK